MSIETMIRNTLGVSQHATNIDHPNYNDMFVVKHTDFSTMDKFLLQAKASGWSIENRSVYKSPSGVNFSVDLRYSDPKSADYKQALLITEAKIVLVG